MGWEEQRLSFGATADRYDTYRPDWPVATAAWLTGIEDGAGPLSERAASLGLDVVDLGAGTGKLTRSLVELGHRVTAVDPSEGMLAVLKSTAPQVSVMLGQAEKLPLTDASADVITVAQAWHWVDQQAGSTECARVLRSGGLLAIAWHQRLALEGWLLELDQLMETPHDRAVRRVRSDGDAIALVPQFGELQATTFDYELRLTPQGLANLAATASYVATRPDRDSVLADVEALGRRAAADDAGNDGKLTLPYLTTCYRAVLN